MSTREERAYEELLEALVQYLADPKNISRLMKAIGKARIVVAQPYVERLGSAYRRVYRRPTPRNCTALTKVEGDAPVFYNPHWFYRNMRDRLEKGFDLLGGHPVFSNLYLRRDLLALKQRTLTLFFTPQLVRPRNTASDQKTLLDATSQLVELDRIDFSASLFFLRRSLQKDGRTYNPHLLVNLSFLAYRRFECLRLAGAATRGERPHLDAIINRARQHPGRAQVGRKLVQNWNDDARAPGALEAWASMVAGTHAYNVRSIAREFR